eukprot:6157923-Prymnesium_polylepis.1
MAERRVLTSVQHGTCVQCHVPVKLCHCSLSKTRGTPCARCTELETALIEVTERLAAQEVYAEEWKRNVAHAQLQRETRIDELEAEVRRLAGGVKGREASEAARTRAEEEL